MLQFSALFFKKDFPASILIISGLILVKLYPFVMRLLALILKLYDLNIVTFPEAPKLSDCTLLFTFSRVLLLSFLLLV